MWVSLRYVWKMVQVGDEAPDFCLEDQDGRKVRLSDYRGDKNVVLFFYPRDETPVCTKESCGFRDNYATLTESGAEVIGISGDGRASHKRFQEKHRLPYSLLSDPGRGVAKRYGVSSAFGLLPGRSTFVIDTSGIVRHVTSARFDASAHVEEALEALKKL